MTIWGHPKGLDDLPISHTPAKTKTLGASDALERDVNGEVPHEVVVYAVGGGGDLRGMSEGARSSSGGGGRSS
jgi:hypothetical protein